MSPTMVNPSCTSTSQPVNRSQVCHDSRRRRESGRKLPRAAVETACPCTGRMRRRPSAKLLTVCAPDLRSVGVRLFNFGNDGHTKLGTFSTEGFDVSRPRSRPTRCRRDVAVRGQRASSLVEPRALMRRLETDSMARDTHTHIHHDCNGEARVTRATTHNETTLSLSQEALFHNDPPPGEVLPACCGGS